DDVPFALNVTVSAAKFLTFSRAQVFKMEAPLVVGYRLVCLQVRVNLAIGAGVHYCIRNWLLLSPDNPDNISGNGSSLFELDDYIVAAGFEIVCMIPGVI